MRTSSGFTRQSIVDSVRKKYRENWSMKLQDREQRMVPKEEPESEARLVGALVPEQVQL